MPATVNSSIRRCAYPECAKQLRRKLREAAYDFQRRLHCNQHCRMAHDRARATIPKVKRIAEANRLLLAWR